MRFKERAKQVDAFQLSAPLQTEKGDVLADTGDWIVIVDGLQVIYGADRFDKEFEMTQTVQR